MNTTDLIDDLVGVTIIGPGLRRSTSVHVGEGMKKKKGKYLDDKVDGMLDYDLSDFPCWLVEDKIEVVLK